jgi:hypothetical protein
MSDDMASLSAEGDVTYWCVCIGDERVSPDSAILKTYGRRPHRPNGLLLVK